MRAIGRRAREWIEGGETEAKKASRKVKLAFWSGILVWALVMAIALPRKGFVAWLAVLAGTRAVLWTIRALGRRARDWIERGETESDKNGRRAKLILWTGILVWTLIMTVALPREGFFAWLAGIAGALAVLWAAIAFKEGWDESLAKKTE